jgi:hypothetical protein
MLCTMHSMHGYVMYYDSSSIPGNVGQSSVSSYEIQGV